MGYDLIEQLRQYLDYNPQTGEFVWKIDRHGSRGIGKAAGSVDPRGRRMIYFDGNTYFAHRLAWLFIYGEWPSGIIDHVDGDASDNSISNLRDVSYSVNSQNQIKAKSSNKLGFLGVYKDKRGGKFRADISIDGKNKCLGYFLTPEEAHDKYLAAKREFHEGCTI